MPNPAETSETSFAPQNRERACKNKTFTVASLGCPKNLVDSESMAGRLTKLGMIFDRESDVVDLFLLNTCGFLRSAKAEAEDYIRQAIRSKETGGLRYLIVAGCAVASDGVELAERYPQVDAWLSPFDELRIGEIVAKLFNREPFDEAGEGEAGEPSDAYKLPLLTAEQVEAAKAYPRLFYNPTRSIIVDDSRRERMTTPHTAYLKIADGCDRFCSYCAIPNIRGRFSSKPLETILEESSRLADRGVRELVLIAQETTFWGQDLYGEPSLKRLLAALKERGQFAWIRTLYSYPTHWDKDLTDLFKLETSGATSVLPYIDMPLQHCNSEILARMNRKVDKAQTQDLLATLRAEIPELVLRSTFIVGFPGETSEQFQELAEFVETQRFERGGVFEFSPEPGTKAAAMENQVDEKTKSRRYERLYAKQQRVSHQYARNRIGAIMDVLIDSRAIAENGSVMKNVCLGRTYADAPDVDPIVYVTGRGIGPGDIVHCEIVDAQGLDLIAVPTDPDKLYVSKEERREAYEREERANGKPPKKQKKR